MRKRILTLLLILAAPAMLPAQADITVSADLGQNFVDSSRAGAGNTVDNALVLGGALGYQFKSGIGLELDGQHSTHIKVKNASGGEVSNNTETFTGLNAYYVFVQDEVLQPYLLVGAGNGDFHTITSLDGNNGSDKNATASLGGGAFVNLSDSVFFRAELREVHSFGHTAHDDMLALIGLQYRFGSSQPPAALAAPSVAPTPEPTTAAPVVAADEDGDGVPDASDKCPHTPHGIAVDAQGCPLDADRDGVPDYLDKCPDTPAGAKVDDAGCPLDSDGDGVPDYRDLCPNTPPGALVDDHGCPVTLAEPIKQAVNVLFDKNKSAIHEADKPEIEKVAKLAHQYPAAFIEIQGYTDNKGGKAANIKLSQARADAVLYSLVHEYGVDPDHISSKGYGPAKPVASNKTEAGRAQNRRVIAVLTATKQAVVMAKTAPGKHLHHTKPAATPAAAKH